MSVTIKEVLCKKDLWKWVRFPNSLYQHDPNYVPFLGIDELETFSKNKNPAYEFCETRLFLAYKDGRLAGRIAGLINHAYNKKWNKNAIASILSTIPKYRRRCLTPWWHGAKSAVMSRSWVPSDLPIWTMKVCW